MVFITGDTHSDFRRFGTHVFTEQKNLTKDDYVIICGDFGGLWMKSKETDYNLKWLTNKPFTTLFVDGNHENFDMLNEYPVIEWNGGKIHKITDSIFHLMRGQVFIINNKKYFTFGGARSHDIKDGILDKSDPDFVKKKKRLDNAFGMYRINRVSWWEEEMPNVDEYAEGLANLEKNKWEVDYIITHCCPTSVSDIIGRGLFQTDDLTDYFEKIKQRTYFRKWFFGHYHDDQKIGNQFYMLYYDWIKADAKSLFE